MTDTTASLQMAEMRLERAVLNVRDTLDRSDPIGREAYLGSVTRIVIAANTMAKALHDSGGQPEIAANVADLLWRLGEQLGILADGART